MEIYLQLLRWLRQLWPERSLTLAERGCLAMAAQYVAMEPDAVQEALGRIERGVQRGDVSFVCHQLLTLAYRDFATRVQGLKQVSSGEICLVDTTWQIKGKQARDGGKLNDFLLTSQYRFFPAFFRSYDTLTHAMQDEEGAQ